MYRFSCDEGIIWRDFDFYNIPIVVWGVETEPGETTPQVLLVTQYHIISLHTLNYIMY